MALDIPGQPAEGMPRADLGNLYRQVNYTDPGFGVVQVLQPVTPEGADDPSRPVRYLGSTQIMTPRGPLPIQCDIPASSLREAFERFPEAAEKTVQDLFDSVREYEREQASGIVVPGAGSRLSLP